MITDARYLHTNLIARDWASLVKFYESVFGCTRVGSERDLSGRELESGTGVSGARIRGVHLRLPGFGTDGPTLEIFQYSPEGAHRSQQVDGPGYGHIAFAVPSVPQARKIVLEHGGTPVGETVTLGVDGAEITWCYVRDPEGNVIELQAKSTGR